MKFKKCPNCNRLVVASFYATHRKFCGKRERKAIIEINPSIEFVKAHLEIAKDRARIYYEYLDKKGTKFEGAVHSKKFPELDTPIKIIKPKLKLCYYNAQLLTLLTKGKARYFEGIGTDFSRKYGYLVPTPHAWNVIDNTVVDVTWELLPNIVLEKGCYVGVEVPYSFVVEKGVLVTEVATMLLPDYLREIKVL